MKLFKYMLIGCALAFAACDESAVDDLTGIYTAPTDCTFTAAQKINTVKDGNKRIFDVAFSTPSGDVLNMKFVGDSYFLHAAAFTPADDSSLKKGNYIIGADGSKFNSTPIQKGVATVAKDGDNYTLSGCLWLTDGNVIRLHGGGELVYEADPEPVQLTQCLSYANNTLNGSNSITVVLASEDVVASPNAWGQMEYSGSGNFLSVDFYSTDGTLAAGEYAPADANAMSEMTYGIGWDPGDLWGIGIEFTNWGTCWWTVDGAATSAVHITDGNIKVACNNGIFTIEYDCAGIFFKYVGEIEGANSESTPDTPIVEYTEIGNFLSAAVNNGTTLSLQLGDDGISLTPNAWGGMDIAGDGNYLKIDFYTSDGSLAEGTYTPADNAALAEGNFAMGYDPGDLWGIGIEFKNWGTAWMTRSNGEESGVNILDGTITVESQGSDYVITLTSSAANVRYTGPINL